MELEQDQRETMSELGTVLLLSVKEAWRLLAERQFLIASDP